MIVQPLCSDAELKQLFERAPAEMKQEFPTITLPSFTVGMANITRPKITMDIARVGRCAPRLARARPRVRHLIHMRVRVMMQCQGLPVAVPGAALCLRKVVRRIMMCRANALSCVCSTHPRIRGASPLSPWDTFARCAGLACLFCPRQCVCHGRIAVEFTRGCQC